jgi:peptidoglycan hydrolase CwlO-like protein
MKAAASAMLILMAGCMPVVQANPLGKVLELIDNLAAKVTADGEAADKAYAEYVEWCDDAAKNSQNAIKVSTEGKAKLEAKIDEKNSDIQVCSTEIEKLAASVSEAEEDLKKATGIREKEAVDFGGEEKEMMQAVDALGRAVKIIKDEMSKGSSFAQIDTSNMQTALMGLGAVLDAAAFSTQDREKLVALAQTSEDSDDEELGAPAAAAHKSQSGGILDVLEDMEGKAEEELGALRKAEVASRNNYEMLKQGLDDKIANDNKDLANQKSDKAGAEEAKATAQGELEATVKALAQATKELETAQSTCMTVAKDHEMSIAARNEELKVIAQAKKILEEAASGAASFLQVSSSAASKARATGQKVVSMMKKLSQKYHSVALAQLASRVAAEMKYGSGEDPFAKIKGMISDMIAKLEKEAEEEATEKAYCDEEMGKTESKKSDLEDDVAKMTATLDQAVSKSTELKEQIKEIELELAVLTKEQAEMDKIRGEENAAYVAEKADLEKGLNGVRKALQLLRDYYQSKEEAAGPDCYRIDTKPCESL